MAPLDEEQHDWIEKSIENAMLKVTSNLKHYVDRRIYLRLKHHRVTCLAATGKVQLAWGSMLKFGGICMVVGAGLLAFGTGMLGISQIFTAIGHWLF